MWPTKKKILQDLSFLICSWFVVTWFHGWFKLFHHITHCKKSHLCWNTILLVYIPTKSVIIIIDLLWTIMISQYDILFTCIYSLIETIPPSPIVVRVWQASQGDHLQISTNKIMLYDSCKNSSFVIEVIKSHDDATVIGHSASFGRFVPHHASAVWLKAPLHRTIFRLNLEKKMAAPISMLTSSTIDGYDFYIW